MCVRKEECIAGQIFFGREVRCGSSQLTIGQRSNCPVIHSPINAFYVFLMSFVMATCTYIYIHTNICVATYTLLAVDILSTSSLLCKWSLQTCAFSLTALPLWLSISHFFKEFMLFLMTSHYIAWVLCGLYVKTLVLWIFVCYGTYTFLFGQLQYIIRFECERICWCTWSMIHTCSFVNGIVREWTLGALT